MEPTPIKMSVNVPMSSAKNFCIKLYTIRLRKQVGAAAPEAGNSGTGAILLEWGKAVKESSARTGFRCAIAGAELDRARRPPLTVLARRRLSIEALENPFG